MWRAGKKQKKQWGIPLSAGVFTLMVLIFWGVVTDLEQDTRQRQRQELEEALHRGIVACYALEGRYPESLTYLKEHYPLHYNEEQFFVDYTVQGSNLMPDITIIERGS